jgi:hypothetical protein
LLELPQKKAEQAILECLDRGLSSIGESSRQALYWHVEHTYGVKRDDIPTHPDKFQASLESLFGVGAKILVRSIEAEISSVFKISGKWPTLGHAIKGALESGA